MNTLHLELRLDRERRQRQMREARRTVWPAARILAGSDRRSAAQWVARSSAWAGGWRTRATLP